MLERFYLALGQPDRDKRVGPLLDSSSNLVVQRTLQFMNRGRHFWPKYDDGKSKAEKRAPEHAPIIRQFLDRKGHPSRGPAAGIYAQMTGARSLPLMRGYLADPDPKVRAVAIGTIVLHQDVASYPRLAVAARGVADGEYAMDVLDRLQEAKDDRLIPAIITFLETESPGYSTEDDMGVPAVRARKALAKLTGASFPHDVDLASATWKTASSMASAHRTSYLTNTFKPYRSPLSATVTVDLSKIKTRTEGEGDYKWVDKTVAMRFAIRNASDRPVYIVKVVGIDISSKRGGSGSGGGAEGKGRNAFVRLAPGATYRFTADMHAEVLGDKDASVRLYFTETGQKYRMKAWVGVVPAKLIRR